ncbi:hypothetical protein NQ314_003531, partial [Rhamnusium bicolor]
MTEKLANRFDNSEYHKWQEGDSEKVTPLKYITVFLWFAANEQLHLERFTTEVIKWPNDLEKVEVETHFRNKNFPGVIGIIDDTHIRIDKPAEDPDSYLNRKYFYSIQAQVVCDIKKEEFVISLSCAVRHNLSLDAVFDAEKQAMAPEYDTVLNEDGLPDRDDRDGVAIREEVMNNL